MGNVSQKVSEDVTLPAAGNIPLQNHADGTCWDRGESLGRYVLLIIAFQEWARG